MARIPVERRVVQREVARPRRQPDIPAWVWPLIPLVLGALALALASRPVQERRETTTNTTEGNQAGNATGAPVTDMMTVVNDRNQAQYAGRPATFANVFVQRAAGERAFWIGPSQAQQLLVIMDEGQNVDIAPGQAVTVNGLIESLPAEDARGAWGLDASSSSALANQQVYLRAEQVTIAGE